MAWLPFPGSDGHCSGSGFLGLLQFSHGPFMFVGNKVPQPGSGFCVYPLIQGLFFFFSNILILVTDKITQIIFKNVLKTK